MNRLKELSDEEMQSVYDACKKYTFNISPDDDSRYAIEFYRFMLALSDKYGYKYVVKFKSNSPDIQRITILGGEEPYIFNVNKELRNEKLKMLL